MVSWTPGPKCPLCCARLNCVPREDLKQAILAAIGHRGVALSTYVALNGNNNHSNNNHNHHHHHLHRNRHNSTAGAAAGDTVLSRTTDSSPTVTAATNASAAAEPTNRPPFSDTDVNAVNVELHVNSNDVHSLSTW